MVDARAVNDTIAVGGKLSCHGNGKIGAQDLAGSDVVVGTCLGAGTREHFGHPTATGSTSAAYYLVQLNPDAA